MPVSCPSCGFALNKENDTQCAICHNPLPSMGGGSASGNGPFGTQHEPRSEDTRQGDTVRSHHDAPWQGAPVMPAPDDPWQADPITPDPPQSGQNVRNSPQEEAPNETGHSFGGRISHLERYDEPPMFDGYRFLSQCLIFLILFIPYLSLFFVTGALSLIFAVIGFGGVSRVLNPIAWSTAIFELLEIFVMRGFGSTHTVPMYRGMVEDEQSRQYAFMLQGPLSGGNLVLGHQVEFSGRNSRGTFIVSQGRDITARNDIVIRSRLKWRIILCITLVIYVFAGFGVYSYWGQISESSRSQILNYFKR